MLNKNTFQFILILALFAAEIIAQQTGIYVPPQFQKIYDGTTRSWDGHPGPDYWQNSSDYSLKVELDTETNIVTGKGNIVYYNNSPDTLKKTVLRLYPDIFKKGVARDFGVNNEALTEGVQLNYLSVNGNELDPDTAGNRTYTNYHLKLVDALAPDNQIEIEIKWEFILSHKQTLRMGKYREGAFYVAYWYPQVAVYDDVDGWDDNEYLGMVEFYNDINNFDVEITVPENYLVRATGDVLNANDILIPGIFSRYKKALISEDVIKIITPEDLENEDITKSGKQTWHFKADGVPDFSFAVVNDYLWEGVAAIADKETGRRVFTDVIYREGDSNFEEGAYFSKLIVEFMSTEMPGVPFPYSHMTTFCNGHRGGGMESPMMATNGAPKSRAGLFSLFFHEIAHSYFPFYMGINERKYAWMDEGWATFFPKDLVTEIDSNYNHFKNVFRRYRPVIGEENEIPLMVPSKMIKGYSLVASIYGRAFFAYSALQDLLGEEVYAKALKEFIYRWAGNHPLPYDFFFTFNEVSRQDLSWFWNPWFYDLGYCDIGIEKNDDGNYFVKLIGNQPVSIEAIITYEDDSIEVMNESPRIWVDGNTEFVLQTDGTKKIKSIKLNTSRIPDYNKENNLLTAE